MPCCRITAAGDRFEVEWRLLARLSDYAPALLGSLFWTAAIWSPLGRGFFDWIEAPWLRLPLCVFVFALWVPRLLADIGRHRVVFRRRGSVRFMGETWRLCDVPRLVRIDTLRRLGQRRYQVSFVGCTAEGLPVRAVLGQCRQAHEASQIGRDVASFLVAELASTVDIPIVTVEVD